MSESALRVYYDRRAPEYEKVYEKPERQEDLRILRYSIQERLRGHRVLEVACGTGYWTEALANSADTILAIDQSQECLALAREKNLSKPRVRFLQDDAFTLEHCPTGFTAGFAAFWWSHIPTSRISEFVTRFHSKLNPGAFVMLTDNNYVEGSNHPIVRTDSEGNTYQLRELADGGCHEVLKNFPTDDEIRKSLEGVASGLKIQRFKYYWMASYWVK